MQKNLLIVFVKNIVLGKVKTRLAKTIGSNGALNVYIKLYDITERESLLVKKTDTHVYFSDVVINSKWKNAQKSVQQGADLGEKMMNAFKKGFEDGYQNIICIGSDLPEISSEIIENAFEKLNQTDLVFGPATDGGYYLLGMNKPLFYIFDNKPWSTNALLELTINEISNKQNTYTLLDVLNDIDTIEDLKTSILSKQFTEYYELSERNK